MKRRFSARLLAAVLCLSLLLGACTSEQTPSQESGSSGNSSAASSEAAGELRDSEKVTVGQAAGYLLAAASKYNPQPPAKEELMENGEGLGKNDELTRLLALVMLGRAFGELPEPVGNAARTAPEKADLSAVPAWAREALENLNRGGVLDPKDPVSYTHLTLPTILLV